MRKIKTKLPSNGLVIKRCCDGIIQNVGLKVRLQSAETDFDKLAKDYEQSAFLENLYSATQYIKKGGSDPTITSNLLHSELTKIYTDFFAGKSKPARTIYDEIKANALGICPYCGIGVPEHLDHYLPKKYYPQFSITSLNLVPSCLDCNIGSKGSGFAATQEDQILHPYLDADFYFEQQWVSAYFIPKGANDIVVDYYVDPPINWQPLQKKRVEIHFTSFNLKDRFSRLAADELSILLKQISTMEVMGMSSNETCEVLVDPVINSTLPANHWRKVMHVAAKEYVNSK